MDPSEAPPRDDRVLPYTRGLSLFIIPFLVAGFVILYLFPTHTRRLWAWPMQPTMTAIVFALQAVALIVLMEWQTRPGLIISVLLLGAGRGVVTLMRAWRNSPATANSVTVLPA